MWPSCSSASWPSSPCSTPCCFGRTGSLICIGSPARSARFSASSSLPLHGSSAFPGTTAAPSVICWARAWRSMNCSPTSRWARKKPPSTRAPSPSPPLPFAALPTSAPSACRSAASALWSPSAATTWPSSASAPCSPAPWPTSSPPPLPEFSWGSDSGFDQQSGCPTLATFLFLSLGWESDDNRLCYPVSVEYDRYIYPPYDAPLADAYGGRYESVFIILHPFVSVPESLTWKATKKYPSDDQIASLGAKCPWARVAAQTGLTTCAKLNQALLTSTKSLRDEFCDFPAGDKLLSFIKSGSICMPGTGGFEPLLQMDYLAAFQAAGQEELIFVPEFPHTDPIQLLHVSRLRNLQEPFPSRGTLLAPDESFLLTVDWDSFFTLFYGACG